ncbi:MAG: hypothetical protein AB1349_07520 [Elusimicrobiota bacterium]
MDIFKFAEEVKEKAKLILQQDGYHCPLIMCLTPAGQNIIPLTISSEEEKMKTLAAIKKLMEKENVWAYITITEGWMVTGKGSKPIDLSIRPSEAPDSVKILMVSVVTGKRIKTWSIPVKNEKGKITFGKEKIMDTQNGSQVGGLFMGLLPELH